MKVSKQVLLGLTLAVGMSVATTSCTKNTKQLDPKQQSSTLPSTNENPQPDTCPVCGLG
jgi:hypothetical protein